MRRTRRGFKLTELLIATAILILLVGIVWVLSRSLREGATRTACMHNLRQIAVATHQYLADYQAIYPTPVSLSQYIRSRDDRQAESIFKCPRDQLYVPIHKTFSSYAYAGFSLDTTKNRLKMLLQENPNKVTYICMHHFGLPVIWDGNRAEYDLNQQPIWPYLIVLRLSGSVEKIHSCQVRQTRGSFMGRTAFFQVFPDEDDYEKASERSVLYPWCR